MDIFTPPQIKEKRPPGRRSKCSVEYQVMIAKKVAEEGMTYREAAMIPAADEVTTYLIATNDGKLFEVEVFFDYVATLPTPTNPGIPMPIADILSTKSLN